MSLESEIEDYLNRHLKRNVESTVSELQNEHQLLMFGETHVGLSRKAQFFARLVREARRSGQIKFHASEHFHNDTRTHGDEIDRFLRGRITSTGLSSTLRPFAPLLEEIKLSLPSFGVVFTGTPSHTNRDQRLFNHFNSSRQLHLSAGRFTARDRGHFHLGAHHAGRVPPSGSTKTTCGHLLDAGFELLTIRMTIDIVGSSSISGGTLVIRAGDGITVEPKSGGAALDLLPVLRRVSNGSPFIVDLKAKGSPFNKVVDEGGSAIFTSMFDQLLHFPGP